MARKQRCQAEERRIHLLNYRLALLFLLFSDFAVNENAKWENRTHALIQTHAVNAVVRDLKQRDQIALQQRRARLAMLLTQEDEQYREELAGMNESSGDRAKRLVKEARRLKSEREEKRKAFADEQLERQWKESCDDLRTIDSAFFKIHCNTEVLKQIEDKKLRKEYDLSDKQRWASEWESERLKNVSLEDGKSLKRHQALLENRRDLKNQMEEQEAKKNADHAQLQREKAIFQKILEMDALAAQEKSRLDWERKRATQKETVAYNEQLQAEREAAYHRQREQDKRDLFLKMEEYREDTLRVENDKASQRRDIIEFRAYLERRREEERRMEKEMERLVQEDLDRSNLKRDLQWERERLAREQLMKNVYETRSEQLQQRAAERNRAEEELYLEKRAAEIDIQRAQEDELRQLQEEKAAAARRLRDLDSQVAINRERKRLQKEELEQELRAAEEAERIYKDKLIQFRLNTIEQSKRNYGIKQMNQMPVGNIQNFARP